jgi:malonyl CoA-acyl carrier protein transacylase
MVQIIIDDSLAQAIAKAGALVTLVDARGQTVAHAAPIKSDVASPIGMTPEHLAELERRMKEDDGTRIPFSEVIARLRALAPE